MRSRKRLLLSHQISTVRPHHRGHDGARHRDRCEAPRPKKRRPPRPQECSATAPDEQEPEARRGRRRHRAESGDMPLWDRDELAPKLAALMNSDDPPEGDMDALYSRALFEREVKPLVQELKKALATSKHLTPDEKLRLSQLVQVEVAGYARSYCAAL